MTPDNAIFATVAYTCAAIVYAGYGLVLVTRERKLRAKLESLESLEGGRR